jgi:hypothetical protein
MRRAANGPLAPVVFSYFTSYANGVSPVDLPPTADLRHEYRQRRLRPHPVVCASASGETEHHDGQCHRYQCQYPSHEPAHRRGPASTIMNYGHIDVGDDRAMVIPHAAQRPGASSETSVATLRLPRHLTIWTATSVPASTFGPLVEPHELTYQAPSLMQSLTAAAGQEQGIDCLRTLRVLS